MTEKVALVEYLRSIKSYVVRSGRMTYSQQQAMHKLWPVWGLESGASELSKSERVDAEAIFSRKAELVLEIGFGMGDSLIAMAENNRHQDFIGIEVHPPGIGTLLRTIEEKELTNLRVFKGDATIILDKCFNDQSIDKVQIFFPDPWHKQRHKKRRIIKPDFVKKIQSKLKPNGLIHLATDWENYALQMMRVMSENESFTNIAGEGLYATEHQRPSTKFERRGERLGHGVWDLIFQLRLQNR